MSDFSDTLDLAAAGVLACLETETLVYRPRGGGTRSIAGIVERRETESVGSIGQMAAVAFEIGVANDATTGISSAEIDRGGDKIDVAPRRGESANTYRIIDVLSESVSWLVIEVQ